MIFPELVQIKEGGAFAEKCNGIHAAGIPCMLFIR